MALMIRGVTGRPALAGW